MWPAGKDSTPARQGHGWRINKGGNVAERQGQEAGNGSYAKSK
jgi:hypothetical protein